MFCFFERRQTTEIIYFKSFGEGNTDCTRRNRERQCAREMGWQRGVCPDLGRKVSQGAREKLVCGEGVFEGGWVGHSRKHRANALIF